MTKTTGTNRALFAHYSGLANDYRAELRQLRERIASGEIKMTSSVKSRIDDFERQVAHYASLARHHGRIWYNSDEYEETNMED